MLQRLRHLGRLDALLRTHPVVAILGARQVGKTTLARHYLDHYGPEAHRFDLEDPDDLARLSEPKLAMERMKGLVVIDEVQRRPGLFPILRVLVDRPQADTRFLVLGSASPELLRQASETLAGRVAYLQLDGFTLDEVGPSAADTLWIRGGFPRSFLASSEADSYAWRAGFVRTFLERDIPALGIQIPPLTLHRFWRMLAHYHGQLWNGAELARAFGVAATTVRRYLDILTHALVVNQIQPWHENVGKRQVKSPKAYLADSGLLHALLGLEDREALEGHPKVGASWEGFVVKEVLARLGVAQGEAFFWSAHAGAELDLLVFQSGKRLGFEIKRTTSPKITRSMRTCVDTLRLDHLDVVHAGEHTFDLDDGVRALAFSRLHTDLDPA